MLQVIGGGEARSDMTTKHLAELDERDHQLEQRMAELRGELAAAQREDRIRGRDPARGRTLRSGLGPTA